MHPLFGRAATETNTTRSAELKQLSLEELLNQEITIVSRRQEKLSSTPSSVQVITREEIRRSGATSIPEALRLASNLQVAQVDSRQWAIDARGFNNTLANKLLVMIDGRTIYTPLFAGVFWDVQSALLEDIDRIEVVSGPGATLWGANAMNGVINIVTRNARQTQGLLVQGAGGSLLRDFGAIRYGGSSGSNLFYRVYGQRFDRNNTVSRFGTDATNSWNMTQGGFRVDWTPNEANQATLQGDAYSGIMAQPAPGDTTVDGQNVLGRWTRTISADSALTIQVYFDRTWRHTTSFSEDLKTYDFDIQHGFTWGERHRITWGGGYRLMQDEVGNSAALAFLPPNRNLQLFSGFVQDEVSLVQERLRLTLGSKLEHNDYSGFEYEPSARLTWTPDARETIWAAVSRAVRSPSRIDRDFYFPAPPVPAGITNLAGGPNFDSEKVIAFELGYRVRPLNRMTLSLATFYNFYDDIRSLAFVDSDTYTIQNQNRAQTWGLELSGQYQVTSAWRLRGGYTFLRKEVTQTGGGFDLNRGRAEGNDPENQVVLQSMLNLPHGFEFDLVGRYVDRLPSPSVPGFFTMDAHLGWWPVKNVEVSVVGQSLLDNRHPEFGAQATRQEIPRSIYGKISWWF